jgi:hypothetical protein
MMGFCCKSNLAEVNRIFQRMPRSELREVFVRYFLQAVGIVVVHNETYDLLGSAYTDRTIRL